MNQSMNEGAVQAVKHLVKYELLLLLLWFLASVILIYCHTFLLSLWKLVT